MKIVTPLYPTQGCRIAVRLLSSGLTAQDPSYKHVEQQKLKRATLTS